MKPIKYLLLCILFYLNQGLYALESPALEHNPQTMVQSVTLKVMNTIHEQSAFFKKHPDALYELIDSTVSPHVDFEEMARWVVGRNAWRSAAPETKQQFIHAFKQLMIRSYAHSLLEHAAYHLELTPLKKGWDTQNRVAVFGQLRGDGRTLHLEYRLLHQENNEWKVYDIVFENVSLIQGYRAQFAQELHQEGLQAVLKTLNKKNAAYEKHDE